MIGCASEVGWVKPTDEKPRYPVGFTHPASASRLALIVACCHLSMSMTLHADEPSRDHPGSLRFEVRLGAGAIPDQPAPAPWPRGDG